MAFFALFAFFDRAEECSHPMTKNSPPPQAHAHTHAHDEAKVVAAARSDSVPRRVLIAEDDEKAGQQLKRLLEGDRELNVHADTTRDGRQALDALRQNFYSLFLTD